MKLKKLDQKTLEIVKIQTIRTCTIIILALNAVTFGKWMTLEYSQKKLMDTQKKLGKSQDKLRRICK
jgi:hypothetical protein